MSHRFLPWVVIFVGLCGCFRVPPTTTPSSSLVPAPTTPTSATADPEPVRLVVVLYFDQLRGDYLQRWQPLFGDGGFRRLLAEGAWFANCHYPYATTTTGPGHASVLTGTSPYKHGIVNNNWKDPKTGESVYCASADRYSTVPPPDSGKASPSGAPDRMLSPSVADSLKQATGGKGKVFGLSLKDRSAIFPAGHTPDGAYWFDDRFVTSTYYRDAVHPWVAKFNASGTAEKYFGRAWVRFRGDLDYTKYAGADDAPGEGSGKKQGTTFPHPTTGGLDQPGPAFYDALANSPFGNDLLLALAKECITAEGLGQDAVPDLLTVSFSSNDLIGHTWGPDSQEVFDTTLRSDAQVAELLRFLDRQVGRGRYAVVLSADHGVCPLPELSVANGHTKAKRVNLKPLEAEAEAYLANEFGTPAPAAVVGGTATANSKDRWIQAVSHPYFYLNAKTIAAKKLDADIVADRLADWLRGRDEIYRVYTRSQLLATSHSTNWDEIAERVRRSFHPDRSGDVYVVTKPYDYPDAYGTGTGHGTPHSYDTWVPLIAYGPGVPGGKRTDPVTPQHAAAIASSLLRVPAPRDCEYPVPDSLVK